MKIKRFVVAFAVMLVCCVMPMRANAVEAKGAWAWNDLISTFNTISETDSSYSYTIVLQRVLWDLDSGYADLIREGGGINGTFNQQTGDCVADFQCQNSLTESREVDSDTWWEIGAHLAETIFTNGYVGFSVDAWAADVIFRSTQASPYIFSYWTLNQTWTDFHTVYG